MFGRPLQQVAVIADRACIGRSETIAFSKGGLYGSSSPRGVGFAATGHATDAAGGGSALSLGLERERRLELDERSTQGRRAPTGFRWPIGWIESQFWRHLDVWHPAWLLVLSNVWIQSKPFVHGIIARAGGCFA